MIHFAVAFGAPDAVARLGPGLSSSVDCTATFSGERVELANREHGWSIVAISHPDPADVARVVTDGQGFVVLNGAPGARDGNQAQLADRLLQALHHLGVGGVRDALSGSYSFVGYSPASGLHAFTDFAGLLPIYWHRGPGWTAFSNRSTTVGRVAKSHGWDLGALAWLVGRASLLGGAMPMSGVRYVPPGHEVQVDCGGRAHLARSTTWIWPGPHSPAPREDLSADEWDQVTEELVASVRSSASVSDAPDLFLTGGKDSRLCLALASAAGLQDEMVTVTTGPATSPEVACAREVASVAGFVHRRPGVDVAPTRAAPAPSAASIDAGMGWRRLRQHVYRYEAILSAWDGTFDAGRSTFRIKGFGGELYRRSHVKAFRTSDPPTVPAMAAELLRLHRRQDPLGIVSPQQAAVQEAWLEHWVARNASNVRLDLIPEKLYVDYQLSHWTGLLVQGRPHSVTLAPLLVQTVAQKAFELNAAARSAERLHYEVMRRTAPALLTVPFLRDTWDERLSDAPRVPAWASVMPSSGPRRQGGSALPQSWLTRFLAAQAAEIEALFHEARETAMSEICDMDRLRDAARRAGAFDSVIPARTVVSAIGVALALLDRDEAWLMS